MKTVMGTSAEKTVYYENISVFSGDWGTRLGHTQGNLSCGDRGMKKMETNYLN